MKYLFAVMDDETRFWIPQEVADHKGTERCKTTIQRSQENHWQEPSATTILMELQISKKHSPMSFSQRQFQELSTSKIFHMAGEIHNNKMERMNGEVRDREKVVRGVKSIESPDLQGFQILPQLHETSPELSEKRHPQKSRESRLKGVNKWITLIQNARELMNKSIP